MSILSFQYHCACCDRVLTVEDKECPECGSHMIRSPYRAWMLCIMACLVVVVVFKVAQLYIQNQQADTPVQQQTWLKVLNDQR